MVIDLCAWCLSTPQLHDRCLGDIPDRAMNLSGSCRCECRNQGGLW